uniref:Peptidase S1 domain-containing protein n=1 Tax=Anopheles atroparvus TaxID=41427 RepID=A0A182JC80_ANOAO
MVHFIILLLCISSAFAGSDEVEIWRSVQVRRPMESGLYWRVSGRIVGGNDANITDFPYQLSLRKFDSHICGASVISSQYAVTAAHCVYPKPFLDFMTLSGGSANRTDGVIFTVDEIILHPMFNRNIYNNDIALIRIHGSFLDYDNIGIVALQSSAIAISTTNPTYCTVSGWGQTNFQIEDLPEILKSVKIPLVPYNDCRRKWSPYSVTTSMTCAGELRRDSCSGDSGGPLVCNNRLYGIVSWGDDSCGSSYPGVYTSISASNVFNFLDQYV